METHNHLFFECDFLFLVISELLPDLGSFLMQPMLSQLLEHFESIQDYKSKYKLFCYFVVCVVVYYLWRERNNRRFSGAWVSHSSLCVTVRNAIRLKAFKWKNFEELKEFFPTILC